MVPLNKVLAVKINRNYGKVVQIIIPYDIKDNLVYYKNGFGVSWATVDIDDVEILHNYGKLQNNTKWLDDVERHYYKTYHFLEPVDVMNTEPEFKYGWLSPDGLFYECPYGDHDSTAKAICIFLYDLVLSTFDAREHLIKTWLRVYNDFASGREDTEDMTLEQRNILIKLGEYWDVDFYLRDTVIDLKEPLNIRFFVPNTRMLGWLVRYAGQRYIFDIGAGNGELVEDINNRMKDKAFGIDLLKSNPMGPVYQMDATNTDLIRKCPNNYLCLFCRPSHGDWITDTINQLPQDVEVLYIGLPENVEDDLYGLNYKEITHQGLSKDNEVVYRIER